MSSPRIWLRNVPVSDVISGFRRVLNKVFALLAYNAALVCSLLPKFRGSLSLPSSRVKQSIFLGLLDPEDGTDRLLTNYQSTLRNIR
jgi:hypothetical protein